MGQVNLIQIANKANVSITLVSQVLNNKKVRVSEETRNRILEIAKELNYIPNRMAAGLRSSKTNIIGCLVPNFNTPFYGNLINTIVSSAYNNGYECMLFNTFDDAERMRNSLQLYASGLFDGMIIVPCDKEKNTDLYESMRVSRFPFVFLYRDIPGFNVPSVNENGFESAYEVTSNYIKQGHKKIAFIVPQRYTNVSLVIGRTEGYMRAVEENGIEPIKYVAKEKIEDTDPLYLDMGKKRHCTACIVSSSRDVQYVLSSLSRNGLHVPDDVEMSIFGQFALSMSENEDIGIAATIKEVPRIIEMNSEEMGKKAIHLLLKLIRKKST